MVEDIVQTEKWPGPGGQEGIHFYDVVVARAQADESGDHQVTVAGVIIVLTALLASFARTPGPLGPGLEPVREIQSPVKGLRFSLIQGTTRPSARFRR